MTLQVAPKNMVQVYFNLANARIVSLVLLASQPSIIEVHLKLIQKIAQFHQEAQRFVTELKL